MQKYDEAIQQCDKVLELDANFRGALEVKGWAYYMTGQTGKAIDTLKKYHQLVGHPLKGLTMLGFIYASTGNREEALKILEKMNQRAQQEPEVSLSSDLLIVHFGLENWDKVDYYVEQIFKERSGLMYLITSPELEKVRERTKFKELMEEYELTEVT
jgi:tetratricopeptide (TPR) repeat protein